MSNNTTDRQLLSESNTRLGPVYANKTIQHYQKSNSKDSLQSIAESDKQMPNQQLQIKKLQTMKQQGVNLSRRKIMNNPQQLPLIQQSVSLSKIDRDSKWAKLTSQTTLVNRFIKRLIKNARILQEWQKEMFTKDIYLNEAKPNQYSTDEDTNKEIYKFLLPGSKLILYWDLITIFINILSLWVGFFIFSFMPNLVNIFYINTLIILFILTDMLVDMNRPILIQGEVVINRKIVFQHYIRNYLFKDLLYIITWILHYFELYQFPLNMFIIIIVSCISLIKIKRKYNSYIEANYLKGAASNALFDLTTLIISIYLFAHMMACIWHYVAFATQSYYGNSWLIHYELVESAMAVKYNYAFYWATMTMVTVGYGDITPQNQMEMLVVNILMFLSSCMFAFTMNSIGIILKSIQDSQVKYKKSLILINSYMIKNEVEQSIQSRVRNYLKYHIQQEVNENKEELGQLINELPKGLRIELNKNIQDKQIKKIKPITTNFTQNTIDNMATIVEQLQFTPGDVIYHRLDEKDQSVYYIETGEVQFCEDKSNRILEVLKNDQTFGEYQFFTGQQTIYQAISKGFTQLSRIQRNKAMNFIKSNEKDWERFHNIQDNLLLYNNYQVINKKCNYCNQTTHDNINCPLLTYKPDLEPLIKRLLFQQTSNPRMQFTRTGQKINSIQISEEIDRSIKEFMNNNLIISAEVFQTPPKTKKMTTILDLRQPTEQAENEVAQNLNHKKPSAGTFQRFSMVLDRSVNSIEFNKIPQNQKYTTFMQDLKQCYAYTQMDIDKMKSYLEYMPHNNAANTIQQYQNITQWDMVEDTKLFKSYSKYSINFNVMQKMDALKKKIEQKIKKARYVFQKK